MRYYVACNPFDFHKRNEKARKASTIRIKLNKLIENFRDFFVVPSSVMGDSIGKDTYKVDMPDIIKRDEIKKLLNVFTDENVLDLEQAYVYINLVEQPDGTIEEVVIDKSEKTEDTVVRLEMDNMTTNIKLNVQPFFLLFILATILFN